MTSLAMSGRNSSHEAEVGRHGVSYCTKSKTSMDRTRSITTIGASGGVISSRVEGTIAEGLKIECPLEMEELVDLHMLPKEPSKHHEERRKIFLTHIVI